MDYVKLINCMRCGMCLPTCPTYALWHEEMDSPRGRIWLMQGAVDGTLTLNPTVTQHFDRCLGCMACVTACPSGVQYDRLIELTRERVEQEVRRPLSERALRALVFAVLPHPKRMRRLLPLARFAPFPQLRELAPPWREPVAPPAETAAVGERLARVGLLTGCVQSVLFGEANRATARVLAAHGYPGSVRTGDAISGLDATPPAGSKVFHAATRSEDGRVLSSGGRVLTVCALGRDIAQARERAYAAIEGVHFDGMFYRRDIGHRALGR